MFHSEFILNYMPRWNKEQSLDVLRACKILERSARNLEEDARDNTPAPTN